MESQRESGSGRRSKFPPPGENGTPLRPDGHDQPMNKLEADLETTRILSQLLRDVLTSENAGKFIDFVNAQRTNGAKQAAESRVKVAEIQAIHAKRSNWFFIAALVLCLAFLGLVIFWLRADKDTLLPTLSALIGLMAGTGGGYVFGRNAVTGGNG